MCFFIIYRLSCNMDILHRFTLFINKKTHLLFKILIMCNHVCWDLNLLQDLLSKAIANFSFFIWTHELLPLDILLLALIDRDDDPYALRIVVCFLEYFLFMLLN